MSLPYYLSIAGKRIVEFILFPRVLGLCELQTALFKILTWAAESISYNNNNYAMTASFLIIYNK